MSSLSYGEIPAPSVCSPTRTRKHPRMCIWRAWRSSACTTRDTQLRSESSNPGKVRAYYANYGIERQSSTPYQHWQNSVKRDIKTMIHNISAVVVHGSILMRADSRNRALKHWIKVHNDLPRSISQPVLTQCYHGD